MFKFIILTLCCIPVCLCAQEQDSTAVTPTRYDILEELAKEPGNGGKVQLHCEPAIANLLQWHIHLNERQKTFPGYRIQIYSVNSYGCNINELKEKRNHFEETFRTIPAYLKYFDPEFKIRVGNYHSRLESIPELHRIRKLFPSSYPVKTEISLEELKRIPMQDIPQEEEPKTEVSPL